MAQLDAMREILMAGIQAPSGENAQPWRFKIEGEKAYLFNRPEADRSLYNFLQHGSYVAHGALLENVRIAAASQGYETVVKLFPDKQAVDLVATIEFKKAAPKREPLYDAIPKRATNRKPYDGSPLSETEKRELLAGTEFSVRLMLVEDREKIAALAKAASINETMLIRNKNVHDFFFSHVRWTPEENELQPNGFYIKTLELKPPQAAAFKLFRRWGAAKLAARLGMAGAIGGDNEKIYNTASAIIAVVAKGSAPEHLVRGGSALERAWLTATKLGLSVQPMAGALFLAEGATAGNRGSFSDEERADLEATRRTFYGTFGVDSAKEHIVLAFRVGRGGEPSARAARFPLDAFFEESLMKAERALPKIAADRRTLIDHILKDLETLRDNPAFPNQYAVRENIIFFNAIKSFPRYLRWLIRRAPKLDRARLLELTDFPFPRWDREMHLKLMEVESREFPGLVKPLVGRLMELIVQKSNGPFIGVNLGCGGMEVERQIIKKLIDDKSGQRIVLIGVDQSPVTRELAKENLQDIEPFIAIHEVDTLNQTLLDSILKKETGRHIVILAKNDIFLLPKEFSKRTFDVIYHTLFKHHLDASQKRNLDFQVVLLANKFLEYDGYMNWHILFPQTIVGWKHPVFLSAEVLSEMRYFKKKELMGQYRNLRINFYPNLGTYLLEKDLP